MAVGGHIGRFYNISDSAGDFPGDGRHSYSMDKLGIQRDGLGRQRCMVWHGHRFVCKKRDCQRPVLAWWLERKAGLVFRRSPDLYSAIRSRECNSVLQNESESCAVYRADGAAAGTIRSPVCRQGPVAGANGAHWNTRFRKQNRSRQEIESDKEFMRKPTSKRVKFDNGRGEVLSGIMEWPAGVPQAFALFSHCFTCGKDLKATVRISRRLAEHGVAVLRYDFTGLGDSDGDFSQTNFTTNCQDIEAAARFLQEKHSAPSLLIGHSLGGTASATTANKIDSVRAVVTIASPGSTLRLAEFLSESNPQIEEDGEGTVNIGGFNYLLRRQLLEDLRSFDIETEIGKLRLPILMFHSTADRTLPYSRGVRMFEAVTSPKSFVTLDGSDHLLVDRPDDANYVADMIQGWSSRYL